MMLILFILFLILVALDIVAWKWGNDSRSRTNRQERKDAWVGSQEAR